MVPNIVPAAAIARDNRLPHCSPHAAWLSSSTGSAGNVHHAAGNVQQVQCPTCNNPACNSPQATLQLQCYEQVGRIVEAKKHPDADKLYVEQIDLGEPEPRTICRSNPTNNNNNTRSHSLHSPAIHAARWDAVRRVVSSLSCCAVLPRTMLS